MIEEYKKSLKKLVADNKIKEVISGLTDFSNNNENIKDEIVLISSRLESLEERVRKGMLSHVEEDNLKNQITDSLLALINKISKVDYILYVENSEIVVKLRKNLENIELEKSKYEKDTQILKEQISMLEKKINHLEDKAEEAKITISNLKELQEAKLVKLCDNCQGKGFITEILDVKFTLHLKSINPFKKELHTQQIKEQLEKQIKEKIEEYKLLPSQAIKLHTKMGMSLSLLVIGTVFSPNHKKEISETIEREIVCKECKGTGMLDFEQNKNKKAKD